jgi:hypothetical protein
MSGHPMQDTLYHSPVYECALGSQGMVKDLILRRAR